LHRCGARGSERSEEGEAGEHGQSPNETAQIQQRPRA
jgi:hypothetical protein